MPKRNKEQVLARLDQIEAALRGLRYGQAEQGKNLGRIADHVFGIELEVTSMSCRLPSRPDEAAARPEVDPWDEP